MPGGSIGWESSPGTSISLILTPRPVKKARERGVRLEVRLLERPPLSGSVYAAQPIVIDRPVWRADLLESVDGPPGSHDRTHHHPNFRGWEPGRRRFEDGLTDDPLGWLTAQLSDLPSLLAGAEMPLEAVGPSDARQLAAAAPGITEAVADLLGRVRAGELAQPPEPAGNGDSPAGARISWL